MCNPMLVLTAVSAGVQGVGKYQQGKYQEAVGKNNAIVAKRMAEDARSRGERDEMRQRLRTAQQKSQQRAAIGASGREISGSAEDLLADTAMIGELDAMTIRNNAEREAYGYDVQASNFLAQAKLDRRAGNFGAASTLLAGAGKAYGGYKDWKAGRI